VIVAGGLVETARIHGRGDVRVAMEPPVSIGPGEVRLRVISVGLCGSDLHWYREAGIGDACLSRPVVLGHEFAAVIAEGPRAGERVVVDPADNCGQCVMCKDGRTNVCSNLRFAGHGTTDGALRTSMSWPERLLHSLPDKIGDDEAPLLEPLGVALHALELAGVEHGQSAGVYGCGPIGLLLIQLLRLRDVSPVVATDRLDHRVAAAKAMGATWAFAVDGETGSDFTTGRRLAREQGVDVAFEMSGSDGALSDAIAAVRPSGRVVVVGIPEGDRTTFEAAAARRKEIALLQCRRMLPADLTRAVGLAAAGKVRLAQLVTHRFPLSRAPQAFETLAERSGLKVIVQASADWDRIDLEETDA
jgi:L-iditol 2-dehydrogenase